MQKKEEKCEGRECRKEPWVEGGDEEERMRKGGPISSITVFVACAITFLITLLASMLGTYCIYKCMWNQSNKFKRIPNTAAGFDNVAGNPVLPPQGILAPNSRDHQILP